MRLGHALQLVEYQPWHPSDSSPRQRAIALYQRAIDQVRDFGVLRTQVEPLWGLCRAYAYGGDVEAAQDHATQALEIVRRAGDEWMKDLIQLTMGAGLVLAGRAEEATPRLSEAAEGFGRVGDPFGRCATRLWLALGAWGQGDQDQAAVHLPDLLATARELGYDLLLTRRTFTGLKDDQNAVPLLMEARKRGIETEYVQRLLDSQRLADVGYHPGYGLAVRTLGPFAVWRGDRRLTDRDWKREKARQVFQLLLTFRGQRFHREQIIDRLWPELPPEAGYRDFKVALNAMNSALEPGRPRGANPFFVRRWGNVYGMNPAARIAADVDELERLASTDEPDRLRQALALYQEDYLASSLYDEWPTAERQRLRHLYLETAERLARQLIDLEAWDEIVPLCETILARDNLWEAAYRLLMQAYAAQGDLSRVQQVYQRCAATLMEELGVDPSPRTQALLQTLA
jgi:DNA-binding SARP family transcriptional activator